MSSFWSPRRILLAMVLLASAALVFVVAGQYFATQKAADGVIRGQADGLLREARSRFPYTHATLEELLEDQRGAGLRYIGVMRRGELLEAGVRRIAEQPARGEYVHQGGRVRTLVPTPPPRGEGPPPRGHPPPRGPFGDGPPGPPPRGGRIVIEFEPLVWAELDGAAQRQVGGAAFVLLALWVALLLGWRALGRSAAQALTIEKQKRLAMLGEMSATLAHEIRNPLTSLKGHAQLLLESAGDEKTSERAGRIVDEAIRLETLTTDLMSFLRSGQITTAENDPVDLVEEICESESRVRIHADESPRSWRFDAPRVRQALANLIENGLQAGDGDVDVTIIAADEMLFFRVEDRGDGVEDAVRDRLFEPFVTSRARGTGLGLAVALRIAESHGGTIGVEARDGGGSRFILSLAKGMRDE